MLATIILSISLLPAHDAYLSREVLETFFPEAENFVSRKKLLSAEDIIRIENSVGDKIHDADKELTIYVAIAKDPQSGRYRSTGAVLMVDARVSQGLIDMVVAFQTDGSVKKVLIANNEVDQAVGSEAFLKQFVGRGPSDGWDPDKDFQLVGTRDTARALIRAVHRGMFLLLTAMGR